MELLGIVVLLETSCEGKAQEGSGGRQEEPTTADTAERDAVSPSLELSDGGAGIREGGLEVSYSPAGVLRIRVLSDTQKWWWIFWKARTSSQCEY